MSEIPKPRLSRAVLLERLPGYVAQAVLATIVAWLIWRAIVNFQANARALHLSVGFDFLHTQAGFQIGQSLIAFGPASTYLDAIVAATLNTLLVIALAGAISTSIGLGVAFGRLASGAFVRAASSLYVEVFRNIPLLLQIMFWYFSAIALLPGLDESIRIGPALLNNRGLFLPALHIDPTFGLDRPHVEGFDVVGGFAILPELMALTLGLSIYNGAFLAEIFRAGVLSVPRGQIEAAASVGLSGARAAWLIILPQALRVALPPAGGQYQTLAKASSLAAAIGYPDLMQIVGGTIASQTSQALEAMMLVILIYAAINLCIALIVGLANRALLAGERR